MKLPTDEELSKLTPEALFELWKLVKVYQRKIAEAEGCGLMPASAVKAMTDVVDDRLMQDIVNDSRRGVSQPSGLLDPQPAQPVAKGSGWLKPTPLEPPSGVKYVDQIAESFAARDRMEEIAGVIDKVRKLKGVRDE